MGCPIGYNVIAVHVLHRVQSVPPKGQDRDAADEPTGCAQLVAVLDE